MGTVSQAEFAILELVRAIKVVLLTDGSRQYLKDNDPKCLEQLTNAINNAGCSLSAEEIDHMRYHGFDIRDNGHEVIPMPFKRPTFSPTKYGL